MRTLRSTNLAKTAQNDWRDVVRPSRCNALQLLPFLDYYFWRPDSTFPDSLEISRQKPTEGLIVGWTRIMQNLGRGPFPQILHFCRNQKVHNLAAILLRFRNREARKSKTSTCSEEDWPSFRLRRFVHFSPNWRSQTFRPLMRCIVLKRSNTSKVWEPCYKRNDWPILITKFDRLI